MFFAYIAYMAERKAIRQVFEGLDTDSMLERVKEGSIVNGRNIHIYAGKGGKAGAVRKWGGTKEILWDPPLSGRNTGLGTYTDETGDTLIIFMHNTGGDHSIVWVHPGEPQARTIRIPALNLTRGFPVVGCALVNNELLVFTDGNDYPKMINLPRADSYNKLSKVRLYVPQATVLGPNYSREFQGRITIGGIPQGIYIAMPVPATAQQVRDFRPMVRQLAENWNNQTTLSSTFTAHACAEYVELEAIADTRVMSVDVQYRDTVNGNVGPWRNCIAEFTNRYNGSVTVTQWQSRLARFKPIIPPSVAPGTDTTRKSNLIKNRLFQFAYGFRLRDSEKTLTSPISDIIGTTAPPCGGVANPNYITLDLTGDKWLDDPATRGEIDTVDIYVREGNNGAWLLVKSLEKWEWIFNRRYDFYNDGRYAPADEAFVEASLNAVPPVANTLEMFTDAHDNQRIVLGGIIEGDDNPCVELDVKVEISEVENPVVATASVEFDIIIRSLQDAFRGMAWGSPYERNQAVQTYDGEKVTFGGMSFAIVGHTGTPEEWGQELPLGGFPVYAKGTDIYGISVQNVPVANLPCGSNSPTLWNPPQGHSATGRNVYDCTQTGTALLNNCNDSHRAALRRALENDSVRSTVRIDGLKEGETYIFCLGDFGITLADLNSTGLEWQRKSGCVLQMGSVNTASIKSERDQCTVTIPFGAGGTVINCGTIEIADRTNPGILDGSIVVDGTVFDDLGTDYSVAHDIRTLGVSAERQVVVVQRYVTGTWSGGFGGSPTTPWAWVNEMFIKGTTPTDHNGYFCFFGPSIVGSVARAAVLGVTGDPGNPAGTITGFTGSSVTVNNFQVMNDINGSKWEGEITGPLVAAGPNLHANKWKRYIFANLNASSSLRTHIRARVLDVNNAPLQGIGAILEGGRYTETGSDGTINLVAMGDAYTNNNDRVLDRLVWYAKGPCTMEMPIGGKIVNVFISQFSAGNPFSETPDTPPYPNHLNMADKVATIASLAGRRCFPRGGTIPVGYFLGRGNGDATAVKWVADIRIPNVGENLVDYDPLTYPATTYPNGLWLPGAASLRFTISGDVPRPWIGDWEFLQIVVGADGSRSFQLQWVAGETVYSRIWDEGASAPVSVSFSSGTATEIYIVLTDSLVRYKEYFTNSMLGYLWEDGDLIRILTDRNGNPVREVYEAVITGKRGKWITLKYDNALPQLFGGEVIEIFRPGKTEDDPEGQVYYAIPEGLVLIDNPYSANPTWSQTTGLMVSGDTWLIPTSVPFQATSTSAWVPRIVTRESKSASDFFPSESWGRGKVAFVDPDAKRQVRGALMRYSGSYKPGTNINGLTLFDALDLRIVENWLGAIRRMTRIMDVIFVNCENGAFSIYVGVEQLQTTPDSLTETAGGILGNVRPFAHKFGCRDPLSVTRSPTQIWWYDRTNAAFPQWASNQLQDMGIQKGCHSYFMRKTETLGADTVVCGGWDMVNGEAVLCFNQHFYDDGTNSVEVPAECMTYHDGGNRFISPVDMGADCFGWTRQRFWSVEDGRIWLHDVDSEPLNRIHGIDVRSRVFIPFVGDEFEMKIPRTIWIARSTANAQEWEVASVTTSDGNQLSLIPAQDIRTRRGGIAQAGFNRDMNTPATALTLQPLSNGDPLEATAFVVELVHVGTGECLLVNATLFYDPVQITQ